MKRAAAAALLLGAVLVAGCAPHLPPSQEVDRDRVPRPDRAPRDDRSDMDRRLDAMLYGETPDP